MWSGENAADERSFGVRVSAGWERVGVGKAYARVMPVAQTTGMSPNACAIFDESEFRSATVRPSKITTHQSAPPPYSTPQTRSASPTTLAN